MKFKVVELHETPPEVGASYTFAAYVIQCDAGDGWEFVGQAGRAISFPTERLARETIAVLERRFPEVVDDYEEFDDQLLWEGCLIEKDR